MKEHLKITNNYKYINKRKHTELYCSKHKTNYYTRSEYINKSIGCKHCQNDLQSKNSTQTKEKFIFKLKSKYGEYYDYDTINFDGSLNPISINCKKHNIPCVNKQAKMLLARGTKCSECKTVNRKLLSKKTKDFRLKYNIKVNHKGKYTDNYFIRNPSDKFKDSYLYFLKCIKNKRIFYKVGITTNFNNRMYSIKYNLDDVIVLKKVNNILIENYKLEQEILKRFKKDDLYFLRKYNFGGWSECFSLCLNEDVKLIDFINNNS